MTNKKKIRKSRFNFKHQCKNAEWKPISDRIPVIRLKSSVINVSIVQCYAPTSVLEDEEKDDFYQELNNSLINIRKGDIIILIGDLNIKIGNNDGYENIMGQHNIGTRNFSGELFIELFMETKPNRPHCNN